MIDFTAVREALAAAECKINESDTAKIVAANAIKVVEEILSKIKGEL